MANWSLLAAGTWTTNFATSLTPTDPGSYAAGDLLLCFTCVKEGVTLTVPGGWTRLSPAVNTQTSQVIGKIAASGSETMPAIGWGGGNVTQMASCIAYRCSTGVPSLGSIVHASVDRVTTNTNNIVAPNGMSITVDNCLALFWGMRINTGSASTFTAINSMTNFTKRSEKQDDSLHFTGIVGDWFQTTATTITANAPAWSGTFNDGSQGTYSCFIALLAGVAAGNIGPTPWQDVGGMGSVVAM